MRYILCLALLLLAGCATTRFDDGTKAAAAPIPCGPDNCGKRPT